MKKILGGIIFTMFFLLIACDNEKSIEQSAALMSITSDIAEKQCSQEEEGLKKCFDGREYVCTNKMYVDNNIKCATVIIILE